MWPQIYGAAVLSPSDSNKSPQPSAADRSRSRRHRAGPSSPLWHCDGGGDGTHLGLWTTGRCDEAGLFFFLHLPPSNWRKHKSVLELVLFIEGSMGGRKGGWGQRWYWRWQQCILHPGGKLFNSTRPMGSGKWGGARQSAARQRRENMRPQCCRLRNACLRTAPSCVCSGSGVPVCARHDRVGALPSYPFLYACWFEWNALCKLDTQSWNGDLDVTRSHSSRLVVLTRIS